MEKNKCLLILAACTMLLASCSEKGNMDTPEDGQGIRIEVADFVDVDGIFAKDDAKSTLSYSGGNFVFAWENNDEIGIFPNTGDDPQQMMMVVNTSTGTTLPKATYSGSTIGWRVNPDVTYASYYPMQENYDLHPNNIVLDYTGQEQTGNDIKGENMGHLGDYDYLYSAPTTPTGINNIKFAFKHAGAIVRFRVPTEVSGTFTSLTVTADDKVFPLKMKLNLSTQEVCVEGEKSNTFTVGLENFEKTEDGYLNVWCMMPPVDLSSESLIVTFNKGTASRNINYEIEAGRKLEPGKAYSFNGTDASLPDFIDLGLSVLWASWNVGATSETEVGNYYAWGEIEPKTTYTTGNYKYWLNYSYLKYNNIDEDKILDADDDAATMTYGQSYRMPSLSEVNQLISSCSLSSGGGGFTFTSQINGNSIFVPASGYINDDDLKNSAYGVFWANDKGVSNESANNISISGTGNVSTPQRYRFYGQPVRAVQEKPKN